MKHLLQAAAASALLVIAGAANATTNTLLINGSFESFHAGQSVSNWKIFSDVPGWTGTPNIEIQSDRTLRSIDADTGNYYAELDTNRNSQITQTVQNVASGLYLLEFMYSPRVNRTATDTNDMRFGLSTTSGTTVSHQILGAPTLTDVPHGAWTKFSAMITAGQGEDITVSFEALGETRTRGCGNCGALIDTVSLSFVTRNDDTSPAPVPLPAGGALILSGLGALAIARRRRG